MLKTFSLIRIIKLTMFCYLYISLFLLVASATSMDNESLRELPGEHDSFETIRVHHKTFVDKSAYISKLLRHSKCMRLCRPEKFGKSNFVQMLRSFFYLNKTLFRGLDIEKDQRWNFSYPVIHLDFTLMNVTSVKALEADLSRKMKQVGESYGFEASETASDSVTSQLRELILDFARFRRKPQHLAVILVDEYDWPVRRHSNDQTKAQEMGDLLQEFFSVFQSLRKNIRLLFLTCTTPLDLDYYSDGDGLDLVDLTLDAEFEDMMGLTHEELSNNFQPHISEMAASENETFQTIVHRIKQRYNGYCFSTNSSCRGLYNFQSVLSCLRNKKMENFWHATRDAEYKNIFDRHPTDEYRRRALRYFDNITISRSSLDRVNHVDNSIPMIVCMVLNGYLTYRGYNATTRDFIVGFPNEEVREKFIKEVLEYLPIGKMSTVDIFEECNKQREFLLNKKWQEFINQLNRIALEPVNKGSVNLTKNEFIDRVVRIFQICDIDSQHKYDYYRDDYSLAGTIDLIGKRHEENVHGFVFEFEWGKNAEGALDRLLEFIKIQTFAEDLWSRKISLLAANFDCEGGSVNEWIAVTYVDGNYKNLQASHSHYVELYNHITGNEN